MTVPLVLGINPLIGVDHRSADRAREKMRGGDSARPLEVIRSATKAGAEGITFSPSSSVMNLLKEARDSGEKAPLKLYPLFPALDKYWPAFVSKGTYGLINAILEDLSWSSKARTLLKGGATALTSDPLSALRLYVDVELSKIKASAPPNWTVDTVFLGETFTDMLLSLRSYSLLQSFCESVERHAGLRAGFQTLNLFKLLSARNELSESAPSHPLPVMAPFNPLGFQMNPDRESCERAAEQAPGVTFVAISVLAAGQVPLQRAIEYLSKRKRYISTVVIGTSNPEHAIETFHLLKQSLRFSET